MKTETIPQDLWQRHELEWQAIKARPVQETLAASRPLWQRGTDADEERATRKN